MRASCGPNNLSAGFLRAAVTNFGPRVTLVHTKGMEVVKRTNEHTHAPNEQDVSCCETKAGIRRRARESLDSSHHIVSESVQMISEGTATKLPKLDSLKRTIQRERAHMLAAPVQPTSLDQLTLPDEYQKTAKGEQFLHHDCGAADAERFLIYGNRPGAGWLMGPSRQRLPSSHRCTWCMDSGEDLILPRMVICYPVCSCYWPTRRRLFTGGCGSRFAYSVPMLSPRACSCTSRSCLYQ